MNHEDSIQQRAEMRRGEHPNGTYDAVPLPPLIGTPPDPVTRCIYCNAPRYTSHAGFCLTRMEGAREEFQ